MISSVRPIVRWGLLWRSCNKLDGQSRHLICSNCLPVIFLTKRQAREYAREHYGYIARRQDLRREPHGWRMPIPVRVIIELESEAMTITDTESNNRYSCRGPHMYRDPKGQYRVVAPT